MSRGVLAIWHDIVPEHEVEVLNWYDNEHHFERLAVPGFRNVRRYHAVAGSSPQLFVRYETDATDVLSSPAYLERLNQPTPWTLRCQPQFRNNSRTVCERVEAQGHAEGGVVLTVRLNGPKPPERWRGAAAKAAANVGILGWEYWIADIKRSTIPTREKQLRGESDLYAGAVLLFHARGVEEGRACLTVFNSVLDDETPDLRQAGIYCLAFSA
jgi:hypothetical protein